MASSWQDRYFPIQRSLVKTDGTQGTTYFILFKDNLSKRMRNDQLQMLNSGHCWDHTNNRPDAQLRGEEHPGLQRGGGHQPGGGGAERDGVGCFLLFFLWIQSGFFYFLFQFLRLPSGFPARAVSDPGGRRRQAICRWTPLSICKRHQRTSINILYWWFFEKGTRLQWIDQFYIYRWVGAVPSSQGVRRPKDWGLRSKNILLPGKYFCFLTSNPNPSNLFSHKMKNFCENNWGASRERQIASGILRRSFVASRRWPTPPR